MRCCCFARPDLESGVNGVAVGVKDAQQISGQIDAGPENVGRGDYNILGKRAVTINAHPLGVGAQMETPSEAVTAAAAHNVALARDNIAHLQTRDVGAELNDFAGVLVTRGHRGLDRFLRPVVPVVDVHIGATDGGFMDLDQYFITGHRRNRDIFQPQTFLRMFFHQCFHDKSHPICAGYWAFYA